MNFFYIFLPLRGAGDTSSSPGLFAVSSSAFGFSPDKEIDMKSSRLTAAAKRMAVYMPQYVHINLALPFWDERRHVKRQERKDVVRKGKARGGGKKERENPTCEFMPSLFTFLTLTLTLTLSPCVSASVVPLLTDHTRQTESRGKPDSLNLDQGSANCGSRTT